MHEPMEKEIAFLTPLLSILKPEQRDKLAGQRMAKPVFGRARPDDPPTLTAPPVPAPPNSAP
jgi:hypothetical protein